MGDAVAVLEFHRPGSDDPVVRDGPMVVVEGVTAASLATGPGRYPESAQPGQEGNFAVAGHRTTYGIPFHHLDDLRDGDEVHITDGAGRTWVYAVAETRIVAPGDTSVLTDDPLGRGGPTLTLTTCHPRWSAAQRMIVFAELARSQSHADARA